MISIFTMKIYEGEEGVFEKLDDEIKYMEESNFDKEVSVYAFDSNKAYKKAKQIYEAIKEYCGKAMVTVIIKGRAACVMPELDYNRIIEVERKFEKNRL